MISTITFCYIPRSTTLPTGTAVSCGVDAIKTMTCPVNITTFLINFQQYPFVLALWHHTLYKHSVLH